MGTSVKLMPLAGAHSEGPLCYLLEVDEFRFLLDCGWNDAFDVSILQPLASVAPTIDAVLLSHSDTLHLGAIPYAVGKLGLDAPIYCTTPVKSMGQMQMYDHFLSRKAVSHFDLFTLDDIDIAYAKMHPLKYSQLFHLQDKGEGIVITPFSAGRLLGGTVWKISKDAEDIIYAVDFNHRKERHLNASVLDMFTRPAVLITDTYNALVAQPMRRQRDQEFADAIIRTLRNEGNVLLPVDTAGRVLELIMYLEELWADARIPSPLVFWTTVTLSTIEFAKCSLEWMNDSVAKSFEQLRENPFTLKSVNLYTERRTFNNLPPGPKVVLASMASLEVGFAKELFLEWASDPRNLVLFTERAQTGTLARQLQAEPPPKVVKVTVSRKVELVGEELEAYEREQALKEEAEVEVAAQAEPAQDVLTTEETPIVAEEKPSTKGPEPESDFQDIFVDGFTPSAGTFVPMFPFQENTSERDEYGEVINPDDYSGSGDPMEYTSNGGDGTELVEMPDVIEDERPTKVVTADITVVTSCSLLYMDFEGRADGRAIKSILGHVAPLKLVLIHGSAESTEHLKQHCLKTVCPFVYTPRVGEYVNVTSDLNAYKLRLTEGLMSTVLFRKLGDYELAWVDGEIGKQEDDPLPLVPLDRTPPPHKTVFVGDLKLADFKHLLHSRGISAEFSGGVLRCGNNLTVRKNGAQQLVIEGTVSHEYFEIRQLLYSQYHIL